MIRKASPRLRDLGALVVCEVEDGREAEERSKLVNRKYQTTALWAQLGRAFRPQWCLEQSGGERQPAVESVALRLCRGFQHCPCGRDSRSSGACHVLLSPPLLAVVHLSMQRYIWNPPVIYSTNSCLTLRAIASYFRTFPVPKKENTWNKST